MIGNTTVGGDENDDAGKYCHTNKTLLTVAAHVSFKPAH